MPPGLAIYLLADFFTLVAALGLGQRLAWPEPCRATHEVALGSSRWLSDRRSCAGSRATTATSRSRPDT